MRLHEHRELTAVPVDVLRRHERDCLCTRLVENCDAIFRVASTDDRENVPPVLVVFEHLIEARRRRRSVYSCSVYDDVGEGRGLLACYDTANRALFAREDPQERYR